MRDVSYHHGEPGGVDAGVPHDAVASLQHALHLAAVSARRQSLQGLAEVAERSTFLLPTKHKQIVILHIVVHSVSKHSLEIHIEETRGMFAR